MKIIETIEEFEKQISSMKLTAPDFQQSGYVIDYECGCGERHPLSGIDGSVPIIQEMKVMLGVSVIMKCKNNWVTNVHQKGFFNAKCISIWTAPESVFKDKL